MPIEHAKSPCCREKIYRFGSRRQQCRACGRTWRIRRKRRGRKPRRSSRHMVETLLSGHLPLSIWARTRGVRPGSASERFHASLKRFLRLPRRRHLPHGPYALIADGLYFKFKRKEWVLYVMAVKPLRAHRAFFLDPVLMPGRERYEAWREAIGTLSPAVKKRIQAFVSDGFRGYRLIVKEHGWIPQRCHFHLLAGMVKRHGRRSYRVPSASLRAKLLESVRVLLASRDDRAVMRHCAKAQRLSEHPLCPRYLREQIRELLRALDDFRSYLRHPSLRLPTTTNAMESAGKLIRRATGTARTPETVLRRAAVFLRLQRSITCNGNSSTKLAE